MLGGVGSDDSDDDEPDVELNDGSQLFESRRWSDMSLVVEGREEIGEFSSLVDVVAVGHGARRRLTIDGEDDLNGARL